MEKRLIVIVAMPNNFALDITGPGDVFSSAKKIIAADVLKNYQMNYELLIVSATTEQDVLTNSGILMRCETSIFNIGEKIDTLIIAGFPDSYDWSGYPDLVEWLKTNTEQIRRICSVCLGAFVLAESGFLKNRKATTHWKACGELSRRYKNINVDPNPIFVKDGKFYTSAGASSGIDLSLALVEEDFGREVSLQVSQNLILYLRRPGNQSQFSNLLSQQLSSKKQIRDLQPWILNNLKGNLSVNILADRSLMSPRNFARVFLKETGFTPSRYIERLRIESAKRFLEENDFSLNQIAEACGFGSSDTMRKIFMRNLQTAPNDYRNLFRSAKSRPL